MKFSIVTAIKDGFDDFRRTIPTILGQTNRDFEWIVVDDGSARPLGAEFPELVRDPRVQVIRIAASQGQTLCLNLGIERAIGEWIVRMDGDDLCDPGRLARISAALGNTPEAELFFSDYRVIDARDHVWSEVKMRRPLAPSFFFYLENRNNPICHPTTAFRRVKRDGSLRRYRTDLVNAQDYALWRDILKECGPGTFVHIAEPTVCYRLVRDSLSGAGAREQAIEKKAIRSELKLAAGEQVRPQLTAPQKDAMQAYRILYYRFVGHAASASLREELGLLIGTIPLPVLFLKSLLFLCLRPLRKLLLRWMFGGIYE